MVAVDPLVAADPRVAHQGLGLTQRGGGRRAVVGRAVAFLVVRVAAVRIGREGHLESIGHAVARWLPATHAEPALAGSGDGLTAEPLERLERAPRLGDEGWRGAQATETDRVIAHTVRCRLAERRVGLGLGIDR